MAGIFLIKAWLSFSVNKYNEEKSKEKSSFLLDYLEICQAKNLKRSVNGLKALKIHHWKPPESPKDTPGCKPPVRVTCIWNYVTF